MQGTPSAVNSLYEFGPFCLDAQKRVLLRNSRPVPLTPKAFDTLLLLVQSRGQPISRDDLMNAVWHDSFVEEGNLTQNIFVLRRALGSSNRYIVTIPGHGYQFVEPVREVDGFPEELTTVTRSPARAPIPQAGPFPQARPFPNILWPVLLLMLLLAAGLSLVSYRRQRGQTELTLKPAMPVPGLRERRAVAVLGFQNVSNQRGKDWLSTAIAEMLTTELAAGQQIRTVPGEDIGRMKISLALPHAETYGTATLGKIRANIHADDVVFGSYVFLGGGQIRLDVRAQDASAGELVAAISEKGSEAQIDDLVTRAGADLRKKFAAAPITSVEAAAVTASLPSSSQAAKLYASGVAKLRLFDNLGAREPLLKALAIEPNFALAHSALSQVWGNLGYDQKAQEEAKKAFDTSGKLARPEQLRIEARYRETSRQWDQAIDTFRLLFQFFPDSIEDGLRLAKAQDKAAKFPDALRTVEQLRRLPSSGDDPRIDDEESVIAGDMGDFKRSVASALRAMQKSQAHGARLITALAEKDACSGYLRLGQQDAARRLCEDSRRTFAALGDRNSEATSLLYLARISFDGGDPAAGIRMIKETLQIERAIGNAGGTANALIYLGNFLDTQGNPAQAGSRYEEAAKICRETDNRKLLAYALGNAGIMAQRLGQLAKANRMKTETIAILRQTRDMGGLGEALMNRGHTLWLEGDVAGARRNYKEALSIFHNFGELADLASTEADLAEIALWEKQLQQAENLLREARADSRRSRDLIAQLHVDTVVLKFMLGSGKRAEAQKEAEQARSFSEKVPDDSEKLSFAILSAEVGAASGNGADVVHAEHILTALAEQARKASQLENEFGARLALGRLQLSSGDTGAGRATLAALSRDAQAKGFMIVVRDVKSALSRAPSG